MRVRGLGSSVGVTKLMLTLLFSRGTLLLARLLDREQWPRWAIGIDGHRAARVEERGDLLLSGEGHASDQRIGKQLDQERVLFGSDRRPTAGGAEFYFLWEIQSAQRKEVAV